MAYSLDPPNLDGQGKLHFQHHLTVGTHREQVALDGNITSQVNAIAGLTAGERTAIITELNNRVTQYGLQTRPPLPPVLDKKALRNFRAMEKLRARSLLSEVDPSGKLAEALNALGISV